ncbi:LOW QUALITY PROTEIN: uncharacterized protein LOC114459327 [Gouania willdenowi]|uniref:LOW QUALITY PROTEIN: uncharacterized protein LOC114459327 n=1 Tax=Gouania willdenowi TaxID=441366 RepID=UPI001054E4C4|nr:LOW QUALITY PROTEIN: uncharacterized protein LOC114459327 [Gouania willdenowi]
MAASWAALRGVLLQDICVAATWSSSCTFGRFYRVNVAGVQPMAMAVLSTASGLEQAPNTSAFVVPPSDPYMAELHRCWPDSRVLSHHTSDGRALAAMHDAGSYGLEQLAPVEPAIAALIVSPDEADSGGEHAAQSLSDASLQTFAFMTRELGRANVNDNAARARQGRLAGMGADRPYLRPTARPSGQPRGLHVTVPGNRQCRAATRPSAQGPRGAEPEPQGPVVGLFSQEQLLCWEEQTTDPWVVYTLSRGYTLQFRRRPPTFSGIKRTVVRDPVKSLVLRHEVVTLLGKGAIELVEPEACLSGFYSNYFLLPKKEGGFRPILDLRGLNWFLKVLPFHMLCVADVLRTVSAGDWLVTVDLKDAYFHVPIAPHHRPFLRFMFMDKVYQFRFLPFGLSLAPRIFTRCVAAAVSPLQASGVSILSYLDDWLVISRTREQVLRDTAALFSHIGNLGLKVNYAKSNLVPSQVVRYLGLVLDSSVMRASLSPELVSALLGLLWRFQHGALLQYGLVLRLMGMLALASMVIPLRLLTLRPFQVWMNSLHLDPSRHRHKVVRVSAQCLLTLPPWRRAYLMSGVPMGRVASRRGVVKTDASLMGWDAVWQSRTVRSLWSAQQKPQHINVLELQAVFLALRHFLPVLKDRHVLVRSDNTSAVYHINHQGGTRSLTCLRVAHRLLMWAYPNFLSLRAMHVPGLGNTAADLLSHQKPPSGEWRLHPEVVAVIWATFGRAAVDLFASEATTHCPLWFSLKEETSPIGRDALAHTWPDGLLYAFPPLPLTPATLHRAQQGGLRLLLVAPCWPGRPWFPLLLKLLWGTPWRLPERKDLLSQVNGRICTRVRVI